MANSRHLQLELKEMPFICHIKIGLDEYFQPNPMIVFQKDL